jgi:hypothetical protein
MAFDGSRAQFYRERAVELRAMAAAAKLPEVKATLDMIAQEYDPCRVSQQRHLERLALLVFGCGFAIPWIALERFSVHIGASAKRGLLWRAGSARCHRLDRPQK